MMLRTLAATFALSLTFACASSEPAQKEDTAATAAAEPAPAPEGASDCDLARVAAKAAWMKQFGRVPDLDPADREMMADEHASLAEGELKNLEGPAQEGGDDMQLEAIDATRKANAACEG